MTEQLEGQEGQLSKKKIMYFKMGVFSILLLVTDPQYCCHWWIPRAWKKHPIGHSMGILSTCSGPGPWLDAKETKHDRHPSGMQMRRENKNEPART